MNGEIAGDQLDLRSESSLDSSPQRVLKLLVLAPSLQNTSPGSRFRIEQWMTFLDRQGFECAYNSFEDEALHRLIYTEGNFARKSWSVVRAFFRRLALVHGIKKYDAVFIYEEASRIGPAIIERLIHAAGVPIIYDFCDPVYMPYKSNRNSYLSYLKFFGKTRTICRLSHHVLVGNPDLANYALRYNPIVTIVPITINMAEYQQREYSPPKDAGSPVIGWTGSHSTIWFLEQAGSMLRELRQRREFRLDLMGAEQFTLDGVDLRAEPWSPAREVSFLQGCDVGIMPIPDYEWARLRSHLKVRQFMAVGVPCVAPPVGVIAELIQDGVNGFLADTPQEWIEKLTALLDDPDLRRRMGHNARNTIDANCSGEVWASEVGRIIRSAVGVKLQRL